MRVLRFDSACGAEGCGIALRAMSILPPAAAKTIQPRLRRAGNAPLLPTAPPPEGEVYSPLSFVFISTSRHSVAKTSPSGVAKELDL